ncbi:MAG: hypothetical protein IPK60_00740 [Sandaracinaceae bacterium]|nr:hypothetical protein [Sandaracinaceae bacterium]
MRVQLAATFALLACATGCKLQRQEVASVPQLPYPSCGSTSLPDGTVDAVGFLRAGSFMRERSYVERFEVRDRACLRIASARVETAGAMHDFEIVYDDHGRPLRAWRRTTLPGIPVPDGNPDIRKYELRTPVVTISRRSPEGREYVELSGGRPTAVITLARGTLTPWIQRARLSVGQSVRETVLDMTGYDRIQNAELRRDPDLTREDLGGRVRVYTIYGRDTVFTDDNNVVVGDLNGLRRATLITSPLPPAQSTYGGADPVGTP